MSCQYKDQCPSYSGWCNGPKQDFSKCVEFLVTAYENEKKRMMPNEYQKLAMRTCSIPYDQKKDMLMHAVLGLTSEAGEVSGLWAERALRTQKPRLWRQLPYHFRRGRSCYGPYPSWR